MLNFELATHKSRLLLAVDAKEPSTVLACYRVMLCVFAKFDCLSSLVTAWMMILQHYLSLLFFGAVMKLFSR